MKKRYTVAIIALVKAIQKYIERDNPEHLDQSIEHQQRIHNAFGVRPFSYGSDTANAALAGFPEEKWWYMTPWPTRLSRLRLAKLATVYIMLSQNFDASQVTELRFAVTELPISQAQRGLILERMNVTGTMPGADHPYPNLRSA